MCSWLPKRAVLNWISENFEYTADEMTDAVPNIRCHIVIHSLTQRVCVCVCVNLEFRSLFWTMSVYFWVERHCIRITSDVTHLLLGFNNNLIGMSELGLSLFFFSFFMLYIISLFFFSGDRCSFDVIFIYPDFDLIIDTLLLYCRLLRWLKFGSIFWVRHCLRVNFNGLSFESPRVWLLIQVVDDWGLWRWEE